MKLQEHGPNDILTALKKDNPTIVYDYDLEHSKFTELSKEEALADVKDDYRLDNLLLLIDGVLVRFDADGKIASGRLFVSGDKRYAKKSGDFETNILKMPITHLVKIADKIYRADFVEKTKHYNQSSGIPIGSSSTWYAKNSRGIQTKYSNALLGIQNDAKSAVYRASVRKTVQQHYASDMQYLTNKIGQTKEEIERLKTILDIYPDDADSKHELKSTEDTLASLENMQADLNKTIRQRINDGNDIKAAYRYAASANELQTKFNQKRETLEKVQRLRNKINHAADIVKKIKEVGADSTVANREDLVRTKARLDHFTSKLDGLKADLDAAREDDIKAIDAATAEYNRIEKEAKGVEDLTRKLALIRNRHAR